MHSISNSKYPDPIEVAEELSKAALSSDSRAWLITHGVPDDAMDGIVECRSGYIRTDGRFRFVVEPTEHVQADRTAFHIPVREDGVLIDVVRFTRQRPHGTLAWGDRVCGNASWLGAPLAPGEGPWAIPTPIRRSPLAWLQAGRVGLVYLRHSWRPSRFALLRTLPAIMAENTARALDLEKCVWRDDPRAKPLHWARVRLDDMAGHIANSVVGRVA